MNNDTCPICGAGKLREITETIKMVYRNFGANLCSYYSVCETCGSEQADANQIALNAQIVLDFQRSIDEAIG